MPNHSDGVIFKITILVQIELFKSSASVRDFLQETSASPSLTSQRVPSQLVVQ